MSEPVLISDADYDRRKFVGSSNAAAIMGLGPTHGGERYTAYDVWRAKIAEQAEPLPPDQLKFLNRRKRWEPVVVQMLREELDAEVVAVNRRYVDAKFPYFAAEIDFEWRDTDGSIQNGEIKTVHPRAFGERYGWGDPGTGDVPIHYECQTMFGLGVTGRRLCVVAAMVGLDDMIFYRVDRNDEVIDEIRRRCDTFWRTNVLAKVPPEPQSLEDVHRIFAKATVDLAVAATSDIGSKALRLRALKGQQDALKLEEEALEFDVKLAMGNADTLLVDDRKLLTWKEQDWRRLDQEALKEQAKDIYRKFTKTGRHRVLKAYRSWTSS